MLNEARRTHALRAFFLVRTPQIALRFDDDDGIVVGYGAGLRLEECLSLRVKDLDMERGQVVVRRRRDRTIV